MGTLGRLLGKFPWPVAAAIGAMGASCSAPNEDLNENSVSEVSMLSMSGSLKKTARSIFGKDGTPPTTPPLMPTTASTTLRRKQSIGLFDMDATESRIRRLSTLTQKNKANPMCTPSSPLYTPTFV